MTTTLPAQGSTDDRSTKRRRGRPTKLAVAGLVVVAAYVAGISGFGRLSQNGGFVPASSGSAKADAALRGPLGAPPAQLAVVLVPGRGTVDRSGNVRTGTELATEITSDVLRVAGRSAAGTVRSYWTSGRPAGLRAADGRSALLTAALDSDPDAAATQAGRLIPMVEADAVRQGWRAQVGGDAAVNQQVSTAVEGGLLRAEAVTVPVTLVLLVLLFGSAVAALLPLAIGAAGVGGGFLVLGCLARVTAVSSYGTNLAISLGLGLGIDYGLFMLTRYREERARGGTHAAATDTMLATAGRTVRASAVTVMCALAALLVFPVSFLRSFGYAGIGATAAAALAARLLMPSLLDLVGDRLDRGDLRAPVRRLLHLGPPAAPVPDAANGFWHRAAVRVMRRPVLLGGAVLVLVVSLGIPVLGARFATADDRVLPASATSSRAGALLRSAYGDTDTPILVVSAEASEVQRASLGPDYLRRLSLLPGVTMVRSDIGDYRGGARLPATPDAEPAGVVVTVLTDLDPLSGRALTLVRAVRATASPFPGTLVGGASAQLLDTRDAIGHRLWLAGLIVGVATLVMLFLFTGSVLLPVKAVVLTVLSVLATLGVAVWGFQDGHLAGVLGFQRTGTLDVAMPILMFCVLFGLSMDYEVFLLSRIAERHRLGDTTEDAVALGLGASGRLITAAAALLAIVFAGFVTSDVTFIKLLGFGAAFAVLLDATLIRGVLLPAFMRLAGPANWWAPAPLRRLHTRVHLSEQ